MVRFATPLVAVAFLLSAVALGAPGAAMAADQPPAVVAVVDVQDILRQSTAMTSIQNQVEKKRSEFQGEVSAQEKRLRDQEQELKRQQSVLAADAFETKRRDFEAQVTAVQRQVQERRRVLDQAYGKGLRAVQQELANIIAGVAKKRGLTLVLPAGQTLFADPALAITGEVLAQLNKNLPSVTLDFSAPAAKSSQ
jgi:Skp family chaperone for outer membrane proteins